MHYILLIVLLGVAIILTIFGCGKGPSAQNQSKNSNQNASSLNNQIPDKISLSRDALKKYLRQLANSQPPTKLAIGAMCYEVAAMPNRSEYVCPECGEKTLYTSGPENWIIQNLSNYRRRAKLITKLSVELDESQFCKKCSPEVTKPHIALIIRYPNESKEHRISHITENDLKLISEFLAGKKKHILDNDAEEPLKKHVKRLEVLLGVKLDEE